MDSTILAAFRHTLYATCFTRARDALFDVTDALLTDPRARSFVELSQAASFQRVWPSLYEALEDGRIDGMALRTLFAAHLPATLVVLDQGYRTAPWLIATAALDGDRLIRART